MIWPSDNDYEIPENRNWRDEALCAQVGGELWFPEKGTKATEAKMICAGCPVRLDCLEEAVGDPVVQSGIWGGKTPKEIRDIRRKRGLEGSRLPADIEPEDESVYDAT